MFEKTTTIWCKETHCCGNLGYFDGERGTEIGNSSCSYNSIYNPRLLKIVHHSNCRFLPEKEDNDMSLCLLLNYENASYIASDSLSVKVLKQLETGEAVSTLPLEYDYKKIARITVGQRNLYLYSTGDNSFLEMNLQEMVHSFSEQEDDDDDIYSDFCNYVSQFNVNSEFCIVEYIKDKRFVSHIFRNSNDYDLHDYSKYEGGCRKIYSGASWAKEVIRYSEFALPCVTDGEVVARINEAYTKVFEIGRYFNNSVGGPVRIGKISSNGFSWLQNGYEL